MRSGASWGLRSERENTWQQISLFDQEKWVDREIGYLAVNAEDVAECLGWMCEQSFDDFDYFRVLVAEQQGKKIAILSRPRSPRPGSDVFVTGGAGASDVRALLSLCDTLTDHRFVDIKGNPLP